NGRPQGTYLLIEQVRVDENRVAVEEMSSATDSSLSLTGGYLLELDFHYDNEVQWMDPHGRCVQLSGGIPFGVKYPDPDDITSAQRNYIRQFVSEAAAVLYGADFCNPATGYAKYLDVDSFIDYWIVFEVMGNHELGNPGSVYFHKDRGGKLVAGPCWDFDWGVLSYRVSPQARYALLNADAIWYARLFQDPDFRERLRRRYRELLPGLYTIPAFIDETEAQLAASAARNFRMWNPAQDGMINGDENLSFHDAVVRLKTIYLERLNVVSAQL
ncbi:MAG: CotH kinase family protein, partial [Bacteroidales bacterium]|nr:CotH kinase family protein [Bacteroidales bacterium]